MIRLRNVSLPDTAQRRLRNLQRKVDHLGDYAERVSTAKKLFAQQNRPTNPTFKSVRAALTKMCAGTRRCGYCEDSYADEVEHIKPKDLYPEAAFAWDNYLYACGPCNGPKNNHFAVFAKATGALVDITRKRGDQIAPPVPGSPVLIDPRQEDPLAFMELDLIGTYYFLPKEAMGPKEYQRAEYTINVLRLNDRDLLPAAREEAYRSYRARLSEYITKRNNGVSKKELKDLVQALQRMGHPTVWEEMKRQHRQIPELKPLFEQAPEALDW